MSSIRNIAKSIFSNWFSLFVSIVLSFYLAPFVVNSLGDIYYGIWAVMMQFTGYLYLMDFGIRDSIIKNTAKYRARGQARQFSRTLSVAFLLYLGMTLICILITGVLALSIEHIADIPEQYLADARIVVFLSGLTIAQTFLFNIFSGALMGLQKYLPLNAVSIVMSIVRAGAFVFALQSGQKIVALASIHLAVGVATGIFFAIFSLYQLRKVNLSFRPVLVRPHTFRRISKNLFGFSIYVFINNISQKITFATDALVIALFLPISLVTPYAIAGSLVNYLKSLLAVTTMIFNPVASDLRARGQNMEVQSLLVHGSRLSLFIALPVAIAYITSGSEFIGLWMGPQYSSQSGLILLILAIAHMIAIPTHAIGHVLYGLSKHRILAYVRIGEAVSNLILSVVLIGPFGLIGVAIGTLIPHAITAGLIIPIYTAKLLKISPLHFYKRAWSRPLVNSLPYMFLSLYLTKFEPTESLLGFFVRMVILLAIYLLSGFFVVLSKDERTRAIEFLGRVAGAARNRASE